MHACFVLRRNITLIYWGGKEKESFEYTGSIFVTSFFSTDMNVTRRTSSTE